MAGMLIVLGVMLTIFGIGRNQAVFIIVGVMLIIIGVFLNVKKLKRRRNDGESGDTISYESHHGTHDSSGDSSSGDGGGGGD